MNGRRRLAEDDDRQGQVMRDGQLTEIPAGQLVPGDVVAIEAGDIVPADGRRDDLAAQISQWAAAK